MAIADVAINYWAVLVVAVIHMIIGSIWYSPSGFVKSWMKYSGLSMKDMEKSKKKGMTVTYALALVSSLILSSVLACLIGALGKNTFVDGMFMGFLVWLGFIATVMLGTILWEGKSYKLYLINTGYYLVSLLISGGILAVWH